MLNPSLLVLSKNETMWVWSSFVPSHALQEFYDLPLISTPFSAGLHQSPHPFCDPPCWLFVYVCATWYAEGQSWFIHIHLPIQVPHLHLWSADQLHLALHGRGCSLWKGHPPAPRSLSIPSHNIYSPFIPHAWPARGVLRIRGQDVWLSCFRVRVSVVLS